MNASVPRSGFTRFLESVNGDGRHGLALAAVVLLLVAPQFGGEAGRALLRYDRTGLAAGQWWRLITAHIVHLDAWHVALNSIGAALMWALFARDYAPRQWLAILVTAGVAIDAGFWFLDPGLEWYVGASGVLHGALAAGTLAHLRRHEPDGWVLLVFIAGKLAWEQFHGPLPLSAPGDTVIVDAHLFGALGGLVVALALRPRSEPL